MYRIKDAKRSLDFYTRILGMRLLCKLDFPEMKFSLLFLGYREDAEIPDDSKDRVLPRAMLNFCADSACSSEGLLVRMVASMQLDQLVGP